MTFTKNFIKYLIRFLIMFQIAVVLMPPSQRRSKSAESHTQLAYAGIRNMLFHNEIGPGQKISYRDLSERLGMSQTPVIQALKWLEFQRLVRHEPNRGYYTAPIDLQEVAEIYDLREMIELDLLGRTIKTIDKNGLNTLHADLEAHLKASKEVYFYDRLLKDMRFHLTLARLSGCQVQHQTLVNLFDLLYLKYGAKFLFSSMLDAADQDHLALFEYISGGKTRDARSVLANHLRRVKTHVLKGVAKVLTATRREYHQ